MIVTGQHFTIRRADFNPRLIGETAYAVGIVEQCGEYMLKAALANVTDPSLPDGCTVYLRPREVEAW